MYWNTAARQNKGMIAVSSWSIRNEAICVTGALRRGRV